MKSKTISAERFWSFFIIFLTAAILNCLYVLIKMFIIKEPTGIESILIHGGVSCILLIASMTFYVKYFIKKYRFEKDLINYKFAILIIFMFIIQYSVTFIPIMVILKALNF